MAIVFLVSAVSPIRAQTKIEVDAFCFSFPASGFSAVGWTEKTMQYWAVADLTTDVDPERLQPAHARVQPLLRRRPTPRC